MQASRGCRAMADQRSWAAAAQTQSHLTAVEGFDFAIFAQPSVPCMGRDEDGEGQQDPLGKRAETWGKESLHILTQGLFARHDPHFPRHCCNGQGVAL